MTNLFVGTAAHPAATAENTSVFAQAVSRPRTGLVARSTILFGSRLRMLAATRSFFCNNFFDISPGNGPRSAAGRGRRLVRILHAYCPLCAFFHHVPFF